MPSDSEIWLSNYTVIERWIIKLEMKFLYLKCFIDMQETMSEFKEYYEDEIDDGTKEAYNKALEKLEKLMPYEEALVSVL